LAFARRHTSRSGAQVVEARLTRHSQQPCATSIRLPRGQAAVRDWFGARHDRTGNLLLFPESSPTNSPLSSATEAMASENLSCPLGPGVIRPGVIRRAAGHQHPQPGSQGGRTGQPSQRGAAENHRVPALIRNVVSARAYRAIKPHCRRAASSILPSATPRASICSG
jgi:hypothetical protein